MIYIKPSYYSRYKGNDGRILMTDNSKRIDGSSGPIEKSKWLSGKSATKKMKITCSTKLLNEIKQLIDNKGEFSTLSEYTCSAARYLLDDMYGYFVPCMWDKLKSMGYTEGDNIIIAKKLKIKSAFDDKKTNFQATIPIGLINSYNDVAFTIFNTIDVSELLRYALEYYLFAVKERMKDHNLFLIAHLNREELPVIHLKKPKIEFEDFT